jgi:hypothetical protein
MRELDTALKSSIYCLSLVMPSSDAFFVSARDIRYSYDSFESHRTTGTKLQLEEIYVEEQHAAYHKCGIGLCPYKVDTTVTTIEPFRQD